MKYFIISLIATLFTATPVPNTTPPMLFHSTNQGEAWYRFDQGLPEGAVPRKIVANGEDLWLVTDNDGLFVLPATEDTWIPRSGDLPKTVFATAIIVEGQFVAIGTYQEGVWVSRDGGEHWYRSVFNLQHNAVWSLELKDGLILAGTDRGVYRSYDGGISWMGEEEDYYQVSALVEHNGTLFAARRDGIHASKDGGDSWVQVFDERPIYELFIREGVIYAFGGAVALRSTNGGKAWNTVKANDLKSPAKSVPEALWRGTKINTPEDRAARSIFETKRGWFIGISPGC
ncbi:MAG: hypothetical protein AAF597_03430 [Bacteroidota bacterium]